MWFALKISLSWFIDLFFWAVMRWRILQLWRKSPYRGMEGKNLIYFKIMCETQFADAFQFSFYESITCCPPQSLARNETSSVFSKRFCHDFQAFQACREKILEACLLSLGIAVLDRKFHSNNLGFKSSWPGNIMFFLLFYLCLPPILTSQ